MVMNTIHNKGTEEDRQELLYALERRVKEFTILNEVAAAFCTHQSIRLLTRALL